jgi:Tfp pilus assembly protein PilX
MNRHQIIQRNIDRACHLLLKAMVAGGRNPDQGYAMIVTVVLTIIMFSLLSAYLFSSRIYKNSANAIVDGSTTFYAAESGMNKRANKTHGKFVGFSQPNGITPSGASPAEKMATCIAETLGQQGNQDFQCSVEYFDFYDQIDAATGILGKSIKKSKTANGSKYAAYTYVQPNPQNLINYPTSRKIPPGEVFAGLNAIEYTYRVYASAQRASNDKSNVAAQALLQMDFNSRVIPLFQFAAFYENDLEINPSPDMGLNGPVHTNANLYMAPGNDLRLEGQVTSAGDMYNSMTFVANHSKGSTPQIRIKIGSGPTDYYNISSLIAWTQANNKITPAEITASSSKLRPKIDRLDVPAPGFLSKSGEYYAKADMQVEFTPNNNLSAVPFKINGVFRNAAGTVTTAALNNGSLRSLRQPVMLDSRINDEQIAFCGGVQTSPLESTVSLNATEKGIVARAMYAAIVAQPEPVPYSTISRKLIDPASSQLQASFDNFLDDTVIKSKKQKKLVDASPKDIVALAGNCFLPAPLQVVTVNDRREGHNIQVLQTNIRSAAIWNRDGKAVESNVTTGVVTNNFNGLGLDTAGQLYTAATANAAAPTNSLRRFGMSATDLTEGGLVWHFNIDKATYPYTPGKSVYGFGFSDGTNLPAPLTIATEQAIYLQGDYNTLDDQAAATMGDTIAVLSNACTNADRVISCGDLLDSSTPPVPLKGTYASLAGNATYSGTPNSVPIATPTTIRAAFLSKTDLTNTTSSPLRYSGGLNNYIRMLENWQNVPLNYTGSFISLGTPVEFSGPYQYGRTGGNLVDKSQADYYYYYPPIRNFSFDTSFNIANQLPPLTPKVVYLNQKVFKRDYDSNRS